MLSAKFTLGAVTLIVAAGCGGKVIVDGVSDADAGGGGAGGSLNSTGTTTGHGTTTTGTTGTTSSTGSGSLVCESESCTSKIAPCTCKAICKGVEVSAQCQGAGDSAACVCLKGNVAVGKCMQFTNSCSITGGCCAQFF